MKSLLLGLGFLFASDPNGCGAAVGSNVANGAGDAGRAIDAGALAQVDCGALGRHFFCSDFAAALPSGFDTENTSAGLLALDASNAPSAAPSLSASTLHVTTGTRTFARLHKGFAASGRRMLLTFSEWIDPSCTGPSDLVQTGSIIADDGRYFLTVGHASDGDSLVEASTNSGAYLQGHKLRSALPRGRWARVGLQVDFAAHTADLTLDGQSIMQGEPLKYAPTASEQTPALEVGTLTDNITFNPGACKALFDDVTLDIEP